MAEIMDGTTIAAAFTAAVAAHADRPFLAVPANEARAYLPSGFEITYGEAGQARRGAGGSLPAGRLRRRPPRRDAAGEPARACPAHARPQQPWRLLRADQSGLPRRGDCLSGRPQRARPHPDAGHATGVDRGGAGAERPPAARDRVGDASPAPWCRQSRPARDFQPVPETPASILYTSGTTGRPKGCVLSHGYEVASGAWYAVARRRGRPAPGGGSHLQSAAALSCQRRRRFPDGRHPDGQLPDPARSLPCAALVARGGRDGRHHRPLSRRHRARAAQAAARRARTASQGPLRHRRRHRARAACARSSSASAFPWSSSGA